MKSLFDLCQPRESVFDETKRDDVLDLTDLIDNRINPAEFFQENFLTEGMKNLFDTAFKRFHRQSATGVVKLTQTMGGGKTHSMIALGFLSRGTFLRAGKSFVARRTNRNTGRKMRPVVVFRVSNMNPSTHLENEVVAGRKRL